jgi:hypothetical protein
MYDWGGKPNKRNGGVSWQDEGLMVQSGNSRGFLRCAYKQSMNQSQLCGTFWKLMLSQDWKRCSRSAYEAWSLCCTTAVAVQDAILLRGWIWDTCCQYA